MAMNAQKRGATDLSTRFLLNDSGTLQSGWLMKIGGSIKTVKKRFFILNRDTLFYFKSRSDAHPQGSISIRGESAAYRADIEIKQRFALALRTPERTYYMWSPIGADDIESWINNINTVGRYAVVSQVRLSESFDFDRYKSPSSSPVSPPSQSRSLTESASNSSLSSVGSDLQPDEQRDRAAIAEAQRLQSERARKLRELQEEERRRSALAEQMQQQQQQQHQQQQQQQQQSQQSQPQPSPPPASQPSQSQQSQAPEPSSSAQSSSQIQNEDGYEYEEHVVMANEDDEDGAEEDDEEEEENEENPEEHESKSIQTVEERKIEQEAQSPQPQQPSANKTDKSPQTPTSTNVTQSFQTTELPQSQQPSVGMKHESMWSPSNETTFVSEGLEIGNCTITVDSSAPSGAALTFKTLTEALAKSKHGDTIVIRAGVYRTNKTIIVDKCVQILGELKAGQRTVVLTGERPDIAPLLVWKAPFGKISNLTFEVNISGPLKETPLTVVPEGADFLSHSVVMVSGGHARFDDVTIRCVLPEQNRPLGRKIDGICVLGSGQARLTNCTITDATACGVVSLGRSITTLEKCEIVRIRDHGLCVSGQSSLTVLKSHIRDVLQGSGLVAIERSSLVFEQNEVSQCARSGLVVLDQAKATIRENRVHSSKSCVVALADSTMLTIEGNGFFVPNATPAEICCVLRAPDPTSWTLHNKRELIAVQ